MATEVAMDVVFERVIPLVIARASQSALHPQEWGTLELIVLGLATQIGLEFYRHGIPKVFSSWEQLPARARPLEELQRRDQQFVAFSQFAIVLMSFHYLQFMASSVNVPWRLSQITFANTCVALPLFFIVYDFFYAPFHRLLHHYTIYRFIHKHHHRQPVPTRGNTDAINVHPVEFLLGEYNHVLTIFLVSRYCVQAHALTCVAFLVVGGCLATLNHTRLDCSFLRVPFTNIPIFAVRAHDTHHVIPNSNYGQYIMLWDWAMGTFRPHPFDEGSREAARKADVSCAASEPAKAAPARTKCD